jgi:GTP-binding protein Era
VSLPTGELVVLAVVLLVFAGLMAAGEAACGRVSRGRAQELAAEGRRGAAALVKVTQDVAPTLLVATFLRVMCEVAAAACVTLIWTATLPRWWQAALASVATMTAAVFVVVGVGPRTYGRQHADRVGLVAAPVMLTLARVLGPLARLLVLVGNALTPGRGYRDGPFASEAELRELVDIAEQSKLIEAGEREMIHSVFELGDTLVREVMVPRTDLVSVSTTTTLHQAMSLFLRSGFSRVPVIGEDPDDVRGVLYLKDAARRLHEDREDLPRRLVVDLMRPPYFVPDSKPAADLLREMQREVGHVAIVVDEYGGTAGMITLEDLVEEIVGEISDEYDADEADVEKLADGRYRVSARLNIEDMGDLFGLELEDDDVDTVGGLLAKALGRVRRSAADRRRVRGPAAPAGHRGGGAGDGARGGERVSAFRSGFACLVGRPNAGKSTLTNALVGEKVAITSSRPQTTRHTIRGVVHRPQAQLVLVDTPGLHRPRTLLGQRLNDLVRATLHEVDVIGLCVPADEAVGPGDRFIAADLAGLSTPVVIIVTKTDRVARDRLPPQLVAASRLLDAADVVPVSAVAGHQVDVLADVLFGHLPVGPPLYPEGELTDEPERVMIAELVREAALEGVRDELPHSLAVVVEDMELRPDRPDDDPLLDVRAFLFVERDSQKPIVIGRGGSRLREVGTRARREIEALLGQRVHLDLRVKVAKDWQRDPKQLHRLGF